MPRAFIQNGVWRARPMPEIDAPAQRQATLRVSIAAAVATLAFTALQDGRPAQAPAPVAKAVLISAPEIVIAAKADDRVPSMGAEPLSPFRRRAPVQETPAAEVSTPETTATARTAKSAREAEVVESGMIRTADDTYRLAGIALPETARQCRRIDGLAVGCLDRAQSYLQLLVKGRAVSCERAPQKNDGPLEANCRIGDADIAEQMVRQGWARAGEQPEERFVVAEAAAKKQKLGIWRE
jgi:endonuclease YncB( thermonuclease family)